MNTLFHTIDTLQAKINKLPVIPQIKEYFRIGLTYTSNALEGNSLTETETKIVLEEGITIGGKRLIDHFEAVGHSDAYDFLNSCITKNSISIDDIKKLHHLFYYRINEQDAGSYRTVKAYITGSKYPLPNPAVLEQLMHQYIDNLELWKTSKHPIEYAALAHKELVFIHPFVDGNGRVARLVMNLLLVQHGYTITLIPPVTRRDYITTLEKAHSDDRDFITFIAQMVKETQKDYLRLFGT